MKNFDNFWAENKNQYIEFIKSKAMEDFKVIYSNEKYQASISIDSDDDFTLDCGDSIKVQGKTLLEAANNLIEALNKAKLTYINGDHDKDWFNLRNESIKCIKEGQTSFSFGGNQTVDVLISKNLLFMDFYKPLS